MYTNIIWSNLYFHTYSREFPVANMGRLGSSRWTWELLCAYGMIFASDKSSPNMTRQTSRVIHLFPATQRIPCLRIFARNSSPETSMDFFDKKTCSYHCFRWLHPVGFSGYHRVNQTLRAIFAVAGTVGTGWPFGAQKKQHNEILTNQNWDTVLTTQILWIYHDSQHEAKKGWGILMLFQYVCRFQNFFRLASSSGARHRGGPGVRKPEKPWEPGIVSMG